ncbi:T9SS type A sorting domain-containing protein [Pontibacter akesuensis]|uniref:Por secretion system C-terminal sorting domain-containing protein n=1 Tax=Pontibacter akesuensis TaxID=388950 RepID=A0A1I7GQZ5_9BACT|nr:hypothetical protein [Pontibacter akesuensis]GHA55524.1 hypothetical protein GCM10007389_03750 [Pontibacter akesuensis]SFU50865.1 Por secretion system C-terminal sorting domain-containing protein [Pontibacter akesuensis]
MKRKQTIAMATAMLAFATATFAQTTALPSQQKEHILVSADIPEENTETLSGINLSPTKKGTFQLDFTQQLEENAVLNITNTAGKLVYQKPVSVEGNRNSWRYQLGKLKPDVYLIEVKTSDTTYWTKFRVSK